MNTQSYEQLQKYNFTLGELVYTIRKLNKLTQVEYSKQLDVVQSTISKVEKDTFLEVPFSLISNISMNYHVPLKSFQIGLLSIKKNTNSEKLIPSEYTKNGCFNAETIFYILKALEHIHGAGIYKDLNLPYQFLCLSNVKYSFNFIKKLQLLNYENLAKALKTIVISGKKPLTKFAIEDYFNRNLEVSLVSAVIEKENELKFKIEFNTENQINDDLYINILQIELGILFNNNLLVTYQKVSNYLKVTCQFN
jgi:transcriptional regulator with XRE-family HTH domain